ncbi:membrane protein RL11A [Cercopithecine betaherpesvirus 5]|uniref:Membrane protein RL11A n=1 Tax=Simian cytomegalovirus (strain Colburn) TaxID=50292 RepID=G8XT63_SCMVC|nr:membrane protein RL11A [Cercopithecine betaherpesvirus 5]AEV80355.1 membrane protein RL11A [Cercopithecine betaherpesvirus 5]
MWLGVFHYLTIFTGIVLTAVSGNSGKNNNVTLVEVGIGQNVTLNYSRPTGHELSWMYSNSTPGLYKHLKKYTICSLTSSFKTTETRNSMCMNCTEKSLTLCNMRPQDAGLYVLRDNSNNTVLRRYNVTVNCTILRSHSTTKKTTTVSAGASRIQTASLSHVQPKPVKGNWETWLIHISFASAALTCFAMAVILSGCVCARSLRAWANNYSQLKEPKEKEEFCDVVTVTEEKKVPIDMLESSVVDSKQPATLWLTK